MPCKKFCCNPKIISICTLFWSSLLQLSYMHQLTIIPIVHIATGYIIYTCILLIPFLTLHWRFINIKQVTCLSHQTDNVNVFHRYSHCQHRRASVCPNPKWRTAPSWGVSPGNGPGRGSPGLEAAAPSHGFWEMVQPSSLSGPSPRSGLVSTAWSHGCSGGKREITVLSESFKAGRKQSCYESLRADGK